MSDTETLVRQALREAAETVSAGPSLDERVDAHRGRVSGSSWRRVLIGAAAVMALLAATVGVVSLTGDDERGGLQTMDEPSDGAADPTNGSWSEIPEAPLSPRTGAGVVWAGDRLVVWSGQDPLTLNDQYRARLLLDGAVWTPGDGWQSMGRPPTDFGLSPGGFAVWTGTEVLLGPIEPVDAAARATTFYLPSLLAYDPGTDSWRTIELSLEQGRSLHATSAELVGGELLLRTTSCEPGPVCEADGIVAVDPATGATRALDPGPLDDSPYSDQSGDVLLTAAGDRLLAAPNWDRELWILDPSGPGTWTQSSPPPGSSLHLSGAVWTESEALFLDEPELVAYEPATDSWRLLSDQPADLPTARVDGPAGWTWTGDAAIDIGRLYDPARDSWEALPVPPGPQEEVRVRPYVGWTGSALLLFDGGRYSCPVNAACEPDLASIDWSQSGWLYSP